MPVDSHSSHQHIYRAPAELYVDGDVLHSQEGTTQGDPLAMPMYALASIPLIRNLSHSLDEVKQLWYADDTAAAGTITQLQDWWNHINEIGPKYGYFTNATKTWLVTKERHLSKAEAAFENTGVKITASDRPYLGTPLGTEEYTEAFVKNKVQQWSTELEALATIAHTQPHAAHAAYTHGMTSKWARTTPNIDNLLQPLEIIIRTNFAPALTNRSPPNDTERDLLAMPARLGGIALTNPTQRLSY